MAPCFHVVTAFWGSDVTASSHCTCEVSLTVVSDVCATATPPASTESHISRSAVQHQDSKNKLREGIYFLKFSLSTLTGIGVVKLCFHIFIQRINFHLLTLLPFNKLLN